MARYIQHPVTHKLIPADEYHHPDAPQHYVQGDIEPFVSPVDGSVIASRRQLEEHNRRNNVVSANEFSPEFYRRKAEERARFFDGRYTKKESYARKCEINEIIEREKRNGRRK